MGGFRMGRQGLGTPMDSLKLLVIHDLLEENVQGTGCPQEAVAYISMFAR